MLGPARRGCRNAASAALTRRLAVALVAAAQVAIIALGPFVDAPPTPPGHIQHLAADSTPGCHPYHDEHCVVCRVLSTEGIAAAGDAAVLPHPPTGTPSGAASAAPLQSGTPFRPLHARAPPLA